MFQSITDINLKKLKSNHARLYYFGLGFIQLKIDETYRLHFYSSRLPSITEDIHNHRYDFTSTILKGEITNQIYKVEKSEALATHIMVNESCNPTISAPKLDLPCRVQLVEADLHSVGHQYHMKEDWFHRVEARDCITFLKRGAYTKEFAQIVLPIGKESICPFSKKVDEAELWEIMAEMLQ